MGLPEENVSDTRCLSKSVINRVQIRERQLMQGDAQRTLEYKDIFTTVPSEDEALKQFLRANYQYIVPAYLDQAGEMRADRCVMTQGEVAVHTYVSDATATHPHINEDANLSQTKAITGYTFEAKATALASSQSSVKHFVELIDTPGLTDIGQHVGEVGTEEAILNMIDKFLESDEGAIHGIVFVFPNTSQGHAEQQRVARYERYISQFAYHPEGQNLDTYRRKFGDRLFFWASLKEGNGVLSAAPGSSDLYQHVASRDRDQEVEEMMQNGRDRRATGVLLPGLTRTVFQHYLPLAKEGSHAQHTFKHFLSTNLLGYRVPFEATLFAQEDWQVEDAEVNTPHLLAMIGEFEMMAHKLSYLLKAPPEEKLWPFGQAYATYRHAFKALAENVERQLEVKSIWLGQKTKYEELKARVEDLDILVSATASEVVTEQTRGVDRYVPHATTACELVLPADINSKPRQTVHTLGESHTYAAFRLGNSEAWAAQFEAFWQHGDLTCAHEGAPLTRSADAPIQRYAVRLGADVARLHLNVNVFSEVDEILIAPTWRGCAEDMIASDYGDAYEDQTRTIPIVLPGSLLHETPRNMFPVIDLAKQTTLEEQECELAALRSAYAQVGTEKVDSAQHYRALCAQARTLGDCLTQCMANQTWGDVLAVQRRLVDRSFVQCNQAVEVKPRIAQRILRAFSQTGDEGYLSALEDTLLNPDTGNN